MIVNRRKALALLVQGVSALIVAACGPKRVQPAPDGSAAATPEAQPTSAGTTATSGTPRPAAKPFDIASMKDPIVDNHAHPIVPSQGDQARYADNLVRLMDENNVAFTIMHRNAEWTTGVAKFGPDHDAWVRAAMDRHPGRLFGGLGGFNPASPAAPEYVRSQLRTGRWAFVGELDLRNPGPKTQIPINSPTVLEIARIAGEFEVPFVFHYNYDYGTTGIDAGMSELEDALVKNPRTIYLNAHTPPIPVMAKYPNIWGELSLFNPAIPNDQFFRELSMHPETFDRLCLCVTDVQTPDMMVIAGMPKPITYAEAVKKARDFLGKLPADQRDKIMHQNLRRLLKLA